MFFGYIYRSRTQIAKPSKTFVFTMNFNDFTILESTFLNDFHGLFRYPFWLKYWWVQVLVGSSTGARFAGCWPQVIWPRSSAESRGLAVLGRRSARWAPLACGTSAIATRQTRRLGEN